MNISLWDIIEKQLLNSSQTTENHWLNLKPLAELENWITINLSLEKRHCYVISTIVHLFDKFGQLPLTKTNAIIQRFLDMPKNCTNFLFWKPRNIGIRLLDPMLNETSYPFWGMTHQQFFFSGNEKIHSFDHFMNLETIIQIAVAAGIISGTWSIYQWLRHKNLKHSFIAGMISTALLAGAVFFYSSFPNLPDQSILPELALYVRNPILSYDKQCQQGLDLLNKIKNACENNISKCSKNENTVYLVESLLTKNLTCENFAPLHVIADDTGTTLGLSKDFSLNPFAAWAVEIRPKAILFLDQKGAYKWFNRLILSTLNLEG